MKHGCLLSQAVGPAYTYRCRFQVLKLRSIASVFLDNILYHSVMVYYCIDSLMKWLTLNITYNFYGRLN
jgi:hypothetical protein